MSSSESRTIELKNNSSVSGSTTIPIRSPNGKSAKKSKIWPFIVMGIILIILIIVIIIIVNANGPKEEITFRSCTKFHQYSYPDVVEQLQFKEKTQCERSLDFSRYKHVRSIRIGYDSFQTVRSFGLSGMNELEYLTIEDNAFNLGQGQRYDGVFSVTDCMNLKLISICDDAFSDYYDFSIANLPSLETVSFGSNNFKYARYFTLSSMDCCICISRFSEADRLGVQLWYIPVLSLCNVEELFMIIELTIDLPQFVRIRANGDGMLGDNRSNRKGKSVEPYNFKNSISLISNQMNVN